MSIEKHIGKNIQLWRYKYGYSQDKLAEYLGIKRENISYYENGERDIPVKHIEKIASLFGVDEEILVSESSDCNEIEIAFAFRNNEDVSKETMNNISIFHKIVLNYMKMNRKLSNI